MEVEVFKQNHNIPFPIFPDEDFKIHKALGEVRTPFFIAIKMEKDGSPEIVHTHLGGLTDARRILRFNGGGLWDQTRGIAEKRNCLITQ